MPGATLTELRIDEATWSAGSPERRHEWRLAVSEVVQEGVFELDGAQASGPLRAELALDESRLELEVTAGEQAIAVEELPLAEIRPLADEYMKVCEEMGRLGEGAGSPKLEALDIAKRLVHDEAGDTMRTLLRRFRPDHATARRLFTLIVTLLYDTTRLAAPPHPVRS
ncbi:MAG TPA: UPF0262 family protein [Polyangia bacterium]|nr:UPF0262 family protein [Polyangia bacterium]